MPNPTEIHNQMKTISVIGVVNLLLAPFYWFAGKAGVASAIAANTVLIGLLHESGKEQRPIANTVVNGEVNALRFLNRGKVPNQVRDDQLRNIGNNINAGGADIFDSVTSIIHR